MHLYADDGILILRQHADTHPSREGDEWYQAIGGGEFFDRLALKFYALVAQDTELSPLFGGRWESHARRLAAHFHRMYGQQHLDEAWHPKLLAAHTKVVITHEHRHRWLLHFQEAGRLLNAPEPMFTELVSLMIIAAGDMMAASRGAALQRGEDFDSRGNFR